MLRSSQFLAILRAESENLVTLSISLPVAIKERIVSAVVEAFSSDSFSETAKAWNEERAAVVEEAVETHLIPLGIKWVREHLREEAEDYLAKLASDALLDVSHIPSTQYLPIAHVRFQRIDVAPYRPPQLEDENVPTVLAASWGKGDPKKDEINFIFLDEYGRMREHIQLDNLDDPQNEESFKDLVRRRKPDVVVVGGVAINTTKLSRKIKGVLDPSQKQSDGDIGAWDQEEVDPTFRIPVIYIQDDVAKLYQNGKRAESEFPELPIVGRYCVGLARYAQSPLNEFAALGPDIIAVQVDEIGQSLVRCFRHLTYIRLSLCVL